MSPSSPERCSAETRLVSLVKSQRTSLATIQVMTRITKVAQIAIVLFFAVMAAQLLDFPQITEFLTEVLALGGQRSRGSGRGRLRPYAATTTCLPPSLRHGGRRVPFGNSDGDAAASDARTAWGRATRPCLSHLSVAGRQPSVA